MTLLLYLRDIPINFYLDLSKAFDCINHKILVTKLKHYGIRGVALNLILSYLLDRYQYVQIDDTVSQMRPLIRDVPQGSILGPLLFNVFTYASHIFIIYLFIPYIFLLFCSNYCY